MTEKIGLDAVWNNIAFSKGQQEYMMKMMQAAGQTSTTVGTMNQIGQATGGLGGMFGQLASMLGMSTGGMVAFAGAAALGIGAFKAISGAVSSFIDFMVKGSDSAIMVASRVEQLNLIAQTLAQNQGYSGEAVNELVGQLNKLGISLNVSNYLVAQFSRMQLNLKQSTDLARVAQDAATISNEGSSDALEGLIYGIQTLNIRILRTHGILVDTDLAYAKYGETIGKTGEQLSTAEKQQAMLNEVIAQGATVAGAYEASMMTAGKQLGSLQSRILPDLKAALGAPFQGAFYNVVKGINDVLDAFRSMVAEGGVLYPVMVQLGAVFQILTEPIRMFGKALKDTEGGPLADFANTLTNFIANAATYGANLVTNFAVGMINAASNVLITAINYIANMLTSWFAPGSPPKVAPEIDVWGMETMQEYLEGFTEADFNVLKNIQRPLKDVFGTLFDMGTISKEAASKMYNEFSQEFIAAMASGEVTQAMFDELAAAGGEYGAKLAEVAKKQFELANATKAVTDAEKALNDAKKRESQAGAAVNKGIAEYNAMLRGGASKEQLAAKLAEINASKKAQQQASADVKIAEEKKTVAEENLDLLREQAALVEQQLQMMLDLTKAQIDAAKAAEAAKAAAGAGAGGGGAGGAAAPTLPEGLGAGGGFDPDKIVNPLRDAVDAAAAAMKQKISDAWENIKTTVSQKWNDAMGRVRDAWDGLIAAFMGTKFGQWLSGAWADISSWFQNFLQGWNTFWANIGTTVSTTWSTITTTIGGWITVIQTEIQNFINVIKGWWDEHGANIIFVVTTVWGAVIKFLALFAPYFQAILTNISTIFTNVWTAITTYATNIWNMITTIATTVWNAIVAVFTNVWEAVKSIFVIALDNIGNLFDFFANIFRGNWQGAWTAIQDIVVNFVNGLTIILSTTWENIKIMASAAWESIKTIITTIWENLKAAVTATIENLKSVLENTWNAISGTVTNIWNNIKTAVSNAAEDVYKSATGWISDAWDTLTGYVDSFFTLGGDLIGGLIDGITGAVSSAIKAVVDAVGRIIEAAKDVFDSDSPSRVFEDLGLSAMQGLQMGITGNIQLPKNAMIEATGRVVSAAVPITMGSTNNYYQPNIAINNQINTSVQAAQMEAMILRTVKRGIRA